MTPAIKLLQDAAVDFKVHSYAHDPRSSSYGEEAAHALQLHPSRILKTLVVELSDGSLAVALIAVNKQLNLKQLAKVCKQKKAWLASTQRVNNSTGYILGGVSPLAQKRPLPTFFDQNTRPDKTVFISAGQRGLELELTLADLLRLCEGELADIVVRPANTA